MWLIRIDLEIQLGNIEEVSNVFNEWIEVDP